MADGGSRVVAARTLAELALHEVPDRWRRTLAVVRAAEELVATVPPIERDVLLVAAWVHDIGHSHFARVTGLPSLDGARFLEARGWPPRVTSLVAHLGGAEARARAAGLLGQLWHYPVDESSVADALTYADQTTGPAGERVSIADSLVDAPHAPEVQAAAERVEQRLARLITDAGPGIDARPAGDPRLSRPRGSDTRPTIDPRHPANARRPDTTRRPTNARFPINGDG